MNVLERPRWRRAAMAVAAVCGLTMAAGARAQQPAPLRVNVRVVDTASAPVAGAEVAVVRGLDDVRATGTTAANGRVVLSIENPAGDYQLVVRKIGYTRADRFFRNAPGPLSYDITLRRAVQTLPTVQVTREQDIKRKSYFIDADEIAKHSDILIDASDILKKLRPDMICGRDCDLGAASIATVRTPARACPGLAFSQRRTCAPTSNRLTAPLNTNVWVNGVWIRTIGYEDVSACQIGKRGILGALLPGSMEVLCDILPEHIAQMTYLDSMDNSVGKIGSNDALFVVLKPGIAYVPGRKSYVVDDLASAGVRDSTGRKLAAADGGSSGTPVSLAARDSAPADTLAALPRYRHRLLGVFDPTTGEPIIGARVIDEKSGTFATTTDGGIVSLVFLPIGASSVRISKPGYDDLTLSVSIGPDSVAPLTLIMNKRAPEHHDAPGFR